MKRSIFSSSKMIAALLVVQIFSIACITFLKYNMDTFSSQYREEESKYQTILYELDDISKDVSIHEGYVSKHFLTYNQDMQLYYQSSAQAVQETIEEKLLSCNLEIEDLNTINEEGNFEETRENLSAYFNCSEIAFVVSQKEDLEICEFLQNYYLEFYVEQAKTSLNSLKSDVNDQLDAVKKRMQVTMTAFKLSFILGIIGIFLATIVCVGYCRKLLQMQDVYMEEAETASQAKTKFLSNMSHEIRTPINTVIGLNEMILRESNDANAVANYARDVKNAGSMLLSLVNSILDLSKIEAGRMELSPTDYALSSLLNDVRSIIRPKFEDKGLELKFDVSPNLPSMLYGDDIRIRQILINILTNSCKYTETGYAKLGVYGEINEGIASLYFSVRDTGIGMKPEDLQNLSTRYARFDDKKNRNVEGTGIGMDITCSFLKMMDSELQVESEYGKGSNFFFYLKQPIVDQTPIGNLSDSLTQSQDEEEYEASFIAPKAKVLVVDDNGMNLNVFCNLLKETEIQIQTADSGKQALEYTKTDKYDLIFMDHMMPEMDGIETRMRIASQEDGLNRETQIIALTANALSGAREEYANLGFQNFLSKPIQPEKLEHMIREMLPNELVEEGVRKKKSDTAAVSTEGLPDIEGVDNDYGVSHNGSVEAVLSVMKKFVEMAPVEEKALMEFYNQIKANPEDKDAIANYRIKVHAMKSSAGLFGALQVYGAAAHLEYEAREENAQAVLDVTPYFLNFWRKLAGDLENYFKSQESEGPQEKKEIQGQTIQNLLHQLISSMQNYDIMGADGLVHNLEDYDFTEEESQIFTEIKQCVMNLDAPKCEELCQKLSKYFD